MIRLKAQEVLQVRIFCDVLDQVSVRKTFTFLNNERAQRHPNGHRAPSSGIVAEVLAVFLFHTSPRDEIGKLNPPVAFAESAAKR